MKKILYMLMLLRGILIWGLGNFLMFMLDYIPIKYSVPRQLNGIFNLPGNLWIALFMVIFILAFGAMVLSLRIINKKRKVLYIVANLIIGLVITVIYMSMVFDYISTDSI